MLPGKVAFSSHAEGLGTPWCLAGFGQDGGTVGCAKKKEGCQPQAPRCLESRPKGQRTRTRGWTKGTLPGSLQRLPTSEPWRWVAHLPQRGAHFPAKGSPKDPRAGRGILAGQRINQTAREMLQTPDLPAPCYCSQEEGQNISHYLPAFPSGGNYTFLITMATDTLENYTPALPGGRRMLLRGGREGFCTASALLVPSLREPTSPCSDPTPLTAEMQSVTLLHTPIPAPWQCRFLTSRKRWPSGQSPAWHIPPIPRATAPAPQR